MTDTLPEFLFHWAERTPDVTFISEPDRDRTYTYGQVAEALGCFRSRLRRLGVTRGDRVAILGDNSCSWVVAYLGAIAHGAISVPLNTRHATGDLDRVLDDFGPAAIVGDPTYLARLSARYRSRAIGSAELGPIGVTTPTLEGSEARPDEVGIVCYTSGTTGRPRGVMIRNESLVRNAGMFAHIFQSGPDGATAVVCPLFHNTGYNDGLAHMLLANGRVDKYYVGATGTAEERIRLFRFIRDLTASDYAGWWDVEIIHGSGSPAAEWLQMYREYDLDRAAKHVDGLVTGG